MAQRRPLGWLLVAMGIRSACLLPPLRQSSGPQFQRWVIDRIQYHPQPRRGAGKLVYRVDAASTIEPLIAPGHTADLGRALGYPYPYQQLSKTNYPFRLNVIISWNRIMLLQYIVKMEDYERDLAYAQSWQFIEQCRSLFAAMGLPGQIRLRVKRG